MIDTSIRDAEPLIVCGIPRSGTRFVAATYDAHREVHLQGELHPPAFDAAAEFLARADEMYADLPAAMEARGRGWQAHRRELLYATWVATSKTPLPEAIGPVRWFGHKTPRHDRHWQFYRDFLGKDVRWVFCVRDFVSHYLSTDAMKPKPIEKVAAAYRESLARYLVMKEALGERVSLFVLNDLPDGGIDYLRQVLFNAFSIEVDTQTLSHIVPTRPINDSASGGRRKRQLESEEDAFLESNPDLADLFAQVRYGAGMSSTTR